MVLKAHKKVDRSVIENVGVVLAMIFPKDTLFPILQTNGNSIFTISIFPLILARNSPVTVVDGI